MSRTTINLLAFTVGIILAVYAGLASADTLVCAALDTDGTSCIEWVSQQPLGLPPLSVEQAKDLSIKAWLLWATCYLWAKLRDIV